MAVALPKPEQTLYIMAEFDQETDAKISQLQQLLADRGLTFPQTSGLPSQFGVDVLFVAPIINQQLLDLRQPFKCGAFDDNNWVPHVTPLLNKPEMIKQAMPLLAEKFAPFTGRIENLSLYQFWPSRFVLRESLGRNKQVYNATWHLLIRRPSGDSVSACTLDLFARPMAAFQKT